MSSSTCIILMSFIDVFVSFWFLSVFLLLFFWFFRKCSVNFVVVFIFNVVSFVMSLCVCRFVVVRCPNWFFFYLPFWKTKGLLFARTMREGGEVGRNTFYKVAINLVSSFALSIWKMTVFVCMVFFFFSSFVCLFHEYVKGCRDWAILRQSSQNLTKMHQKFRKNFVVLQRAWNVKKKLIIKHGKWCILIWC